MTIRPGGGAGGSGGSSLASPTPASAGYDVFLLMGQSNMVGYSGASTWDYSNYDLHDINVWQWDSATATLKAGYDPLAFNDGGGQGVSPAMAFARWWSTIHPGRRVLLVPAAIGGTGFTGTAPNVWDSTVSPSLYTQAVAKANAALAAVQATAPASSFAGFLWAQGETDAWSSRTQAQYAANLDALIDAVRANVTGATSSTPFILGRMVPEFIGSAGSLTSAQIDAAHADTPRRKAYTWAASGVSGSANHDGTNIFHYSAPGARALGHRMFFALTNALANTGSATIVPDPPSYPVAVLNGTSGTILTWLPATSNATITGYQVWRSTTSGAETLLATLGNVLTYTDNTATTDQTTYFYKVKAVSASGTSAFSTEASIQFSAQTTIAADTFNRADSAQTNNASTLGTTDTGAKAWTYRSGFKIYISSNTALLVGATGASPARATVDAGVADVDVSATILSAAASGAEGVVARYTDENNMMELYVYSSSAYSLDKIVAGTRNPLVGGLRIQVTPTAGDVLRLVAKGNVYTAYINGVQAAQVTDASGPPSATNVGLRQIGSSFSAKFDNFAVKTAP